MPYRLKNRWTQEQWLALQRADMLSDEDIEYFRRAGSQSWNWDDLVFLHALNSLDWGLAGSLMFQQFIDRQGIESEKIRLENLRVGYRRT